MAPYTASIILASYNRAGLLKETLVSLSEELERRGIKGDVQVVLVDNNSTDSTYGVMRRFADKFSDALVVKECKQGLSHARNAGVKESKGKFLVFIDDDIEIEAGWLDFILKEFSRNEVAVVGGRVVAYGHSELPGWLPREYAYLVSVFDPCDEVSAVKSVLGASFAIRREALKGDLSPFNTNLGRKGRKLLGGEEVELFDRLRRAGGLVVYTPHSTVFHKIAEKVERRYVVDYAYWLGVSEAEIDKRVWRGFKFLLKYIRSFGVSLLPLVEERRLDGVDDHVTMRRLIKKKYARGYVNSRDELNSNE